MSTHLILYIAFLSLSFSLQDITHHGGTEFCKVIGRNGIKDGIAPSFACADDKDDVMPSVEWKGVSGTNSPWSFDETDANIDRVRPYFHMMMWDFNAPSTARHKSLDQTDLGHPKLVSVVIMRHPISRLLAGDAIIHKLYPGYNNGTLSHEEWWNYAKNEEIRNTDNFFLRLFGMQNIATNPFNMESLTKDDYENAVSIINQFTVVLDIQCLNEGMIELAKQLHLNITTIQAAMTKKGNNHLEVSPTADHRERIGYDDVYQYLANKNKWDIELYEYSKSISLVKCS